MNKYFTYILKDNYNDNDRFNLIGKIVEVEIEPSGIHSIIGIFGEITFKSVWSHIDLGCYEHKLVTNKLWKLIL